MNPQFHAVATAALSAFSLVLVALLGLCADRLRLYIDAHTKSLRSRAILERLDEAALVAVCSVEQTVVSKLDPTKPLGDNAKLARDAALAELRAHLGPTGIGEIKKVLGVDDLNVGTVLLSYIEAHVHQDTNHDTPSAAIVVPAASPTDNASAVPSPIAAKGDGTTIARVVEAATPSLFVVWLFTGMLITGCAAPSRIGDMAMLFGKDGGRACAGVQVEQQISAAVPAVLDALAGEPKDWMRQLEVEETVRPGAVVPCAVAHALYDAIGGEAASLEDVERAIRRWRWVAAVLRAGSPALLAPGDPRTPSRRILVRAPAYLRPRGFLRATEAILTREW